jgi:hypothetical protein
MYNPTSRHLDTLLRPSEYIIARVLALYVQHDFEPLYDLSKYDVSAVEPGCGTGRDEILYGRSMVSDESMRVETDRRYLGSVRIPPFVRHGEQTGFGMFNLEVLVAERRTEYRTT